MIVGIAATIEKAVERTVSWQALSGQVAVTGPDGVTSAPLAATVNPATASNVQTLCAQLTPAVGGRYLLRWSYADGSGTTFAAFEERFATFTDAEAMARMRLRRSGAELRDALFEREIASVARRILRRWPQIGNGLGTAASMGRYDLLTDIDDQSNFDEAAALIVCARLVGPLATAGAPGDLAGLREGDEQSSFAADGGSDAGIPGDAGAGPGGYGGPSERRRWLREAAECLGAISFVAEAVSARQSFSPMIVDGPSRALAAGGRPQTLLTDVFLILSEDPAHCIDA